MKCRFLPLFIILLASFLSLFAGKEQFQLLSIVENEPDIIKIGEGSKYQLDLHSQNIYSLEGIDQLNLKDYCRINLKKNIITSLEPLEKLPPNASEALKIIHVDNNNIHYVTLKTLIHLKEAFPNLQILCLANNPLENSKTIKKSYKYKKVGYKIILKHQDNE